jgi:hypothetical protein
VNDDRARELPRPAPLPVEFDTFRVAVALAIVVGALSVVASYLDALALALVALATAGWVAAHARDRGPRGTSVGVAHAVGFALAGSGAALYFYGPYPLTIFRGLVLGLCWLPLWWTERRAPRTYVRGTGVAP